MKAKGAAGNLGELQETYERAQRETLPLGHACPEDVRRAWMRVEHYMAVNPKATVASACTATGVRLAVYERARKLMVGGDVSFHDADKIREGDAIVTGKKRERRP